ncbi:2OG-Fe(II) oxygenase family protein [Rutstroemia sp. NJR-2017a WRK4]|nr:2OG-Fe(II) oxygenase family protein [Rutstroemia sp. NJR-2017a WRK4]
MPSAIDSHEDYYPVPFPNDVPTIPLAKISISNLLSGNEEEANTLFRVCTNEGFFYLDLTAEPRGQKFSNEAQKLHHVAKDVFQNVSIDEKLSFKPFDGAAHLDTGYKCTSLDEERKPDRVEFLNISHYGLLCEPEKYKLPPWLSKSEDLYRSFMEDGNWIANLIFSILERKLHLPPGALTSIHQTKDASGDFLRMLHYPAPKDGKPLTKAPTPSHTDASSITMLFNWQGGLQITKARAAGESKVDLEDADKESEDSWYYVKPEPGCLIVNLGDAMVVLTNGLLKSGKHRVVTPPGPQGRFNRYSVLTNARPKNDTLMRSLKSDMINPESEEQLAEEAITALEWSMRKVRAILARASAS